MSEGHPLIVTTSLGHTYTPHKASGKYVGEEVETPMPVYAGQLSAMMLFPEVNSWTVGYCVGMLVGKDLGEVPVGWTIGVLGATGMVLGLGVGLGVGLAVGLGVGLGEGLGVGLGVERGEGLGVGLRMVRVPPLMDTTY